MESDSYMSSTIRNYLMIFVGELTGTAFLLFFGCVGMHEPDPTSVHAPLVWGFSITAVIMVFGHITRGHFNPCVTTCALILRLITPFTALVYFVADMLGAILGLFLIQVSIPHGLDPDNTTMQKSFCTTQFNPNVTIYQGMLCEFIATSLLIYCVCSAWDPRNSIWSDSVAIKFGIVVAAIVLGVGQYTGASLNPARSFAPALLQNDWKDQWAYWVATLTGAVVTTNIYKYFYLMDVEEDLLSRETLTDQLRQGSLYSKQEDPEQLITRYASLMVLRAKNNAVPNAM